ncbi:class I SAM-dependent methyltransferase [Roseivirga sp.]|uniref:class I SAM-dependent methyltransferase n=1 Tax=Roseivirga sp. TaxID=1964215 RepID=UPI003B516938
MELTFGSAQVYTSERMKKAPLLAKLFHKVFGYTNVGNYARFTIFKKLLKEIPLKQDAKILDVGAGYGEYSFSLAQALPKSEVHSLDIDRERMKALDEAINKSGIHNIHTHCSHTEQLEEKEFDFAFSVDVFEHIAPEDMPFKAVYNRLKPGGYFMVKMPYVTQRTILPEHWFEDHHEWLEEEHIGQVYDLTSLKKRFVQEGFKVVFATYSDGWYSRLGWELAYLGKKLGIVGQMITLPIAKLLIKLDRLIHLNHWGNAIQVIGIKA